MSAELDAAYGAQRRRLRSVAGTAALRSWDQNFRNREQAISGLAALVTAGQVQMTSLVDAYMAAKGGGRPKGLAAPTPRDLQAVYERPYGALGGQLENGAEFGAAMASARASVGKLVATDLQLAQTYAARDWMSDEESILGYERVINSGSPCGLCMAASTQRYHREDLMSIHEACFCTIAPIYGEGESPRLINPERWEVVKAQAEGDLSSRNLSKLRFDNEQLPNVLKVAPDPELGMRLVDETWAAAA